MMRYHSWCVKYILAVTTARRDLTDTGCRETCNGDRSPAASAGLERFLRADIVKEAASCDCQSSQHLTTFVPVPGALDGGIPDQEGSRLCAPIHPVSLPIRSRARPW
jgi:hypothetical protein